MKISKIEFDYGVFNFKRIIINSISLIKGKFNLNFDAKFKNDFKRSFWFYELESSSNSKSEKVKILPNLGSLGPYFPWSDYKKRGEFNSKLKFPIFSDILLNSKTGKLAGIQSAFIVEARKEQLKIISNFYANYLMGKKFCSNCNKIIPVPAKPKYSSNNVEIICHEFGKIFNIPIECKIILRTSNSEKSYKMINRPIALNNLNVLLIDDIFTNGTTRNMLFSILKNKGCSNLFMVTLGKTDHNIYEYDE